MILIFLIFFTSLGSVVATSDNNLSDASFDISSDFSSDTSSDILLDSSEDLKSYSLNEDLNSNEDSINSKEDLINLNDSIDKQKSSNGLDNSLYDSNIEDSDLSENDDSSNAVLSKNILSSSLTNDDSTIANFNNVILTKSQSSTSSLLSSPQTIIIKDASYYSGSINEYIQKIIDGAVAGSTIQFTASSYDNIYLKISKPLNIISKSGTTINNIFDIPLFTILQGGSRTNISGFRVNSVGSFVDARDVSSITISGNKISTKRNAIIFNEVYDSFIKNNVFSSFKIAIDISKSGGITISKNNISPKDGGNIGINLKEISSKKGISILNNNMIANDRRKEATGIYFGKNACNVLVKENIIRKWYTAIDFPYSVNNVTIINNTISDNGDGVIIKGWINNFTFNKNLVTGNARVGVLFDYDFLGTKGNFNLENNFFSYNGVLDLQNKGDKAVSIGKNFAKNKCYRVGMKYGFNVRSRQSGSKYYFSVVDRHGNSVSGLPNFSAVLNVNGRSYTVNFINSVAFLDIGSNGAGGKGSSSSSLNVGEDNRQFGDWGQFENIDSEEMAYYEEFYKSLLSPIMESANSNTDQNSNHSNYENESRSSSNSSSGSSSGSGDSGVSSGSNSINSNGVFSGSSGSVSASVSSASASSSPSQGSNAPESAAAKTLSVDDETFRIIGVGGLVLLIILVIGLYYREDIMEMMKE